jgi:hypothetical protein
VGTHQDREECSRAFEASAKAAPHACTVGEAEQIAERGLTPGGSWIADSTRRGNTSMGSRSVCQSTIVRLVRNALDGLLPEPLDDVGTGSIAAGAGRLSPRRPPPVNYVRNMGETRNPESPEPMTAAERMRGHRARQLGDDIPKVKPAQEPYKPQTLREASLEELIDEVSDRLTGADDPEIRELAFPAVIHSYQTSADRLSFVSIEPFAEE